MIQGFCFLANLQKFTTSSFTTNPQNIHQNGRVKHHQKTSKLTSFSTKNYPPFFTEICWRILTMRIITLWGTSGMLVATCLHGDSGTLFDTNADSQPRQRNTKTTSHFTILQKVDTWSLGHHGLIYLNLFDCFTFIGSKAIDCCGFPVCWPKLLDFVNFFQDAQLDPGQLIWQWKKTPVWRRIYC